MTMPVAVALLAAVAFGLALFVFAYLFTRFYGAEDTVNLASVMREPNDPVNARAEQGATTWDVQRGQY